MKQPPDMSRAAFKAALRRNGFALVLLWMRDTSGQTPGVSYGTIMNTKGKILRRASLAHAIRSREAEIAKQNIEPLDPMRGVEFPFADNH